MASHKLRLELSGAFSLARKAINPTSATAVFLSANGAAVDDGKPSRHRAYLMLNARDILYINPQDADREFFAAVQFGGGAMVAVPLDGCEVRCLPDEKGPLSFGSFVGVLNMADLVPKAATSVINRSLLTGRILEDGPVSARLFLDQGCLRAREAFDLEEHDEPWRFVRRINGAYEDVYPSRRFTDRMLWTIPIEAGDPSIQVADPSGKKDTVSVLLRSDRNIEAAICCLPGFSGYDGVDETTIRHFPAVYDILKDANLIAEETRAYPRKPDEFPFTHDLVNDCFACNEVTI